MKQERVRKMQEDKEWEAIVRMGGKNQLREEKRSLVLEQRKEREMQLKKQVDFKDKEI